MPQFDPALFTPQLFWLLLTFIALYALMALVALPKIGAVLDERQRRIDDNLDKAAQLKAEADAAVAAYEKALAESRAQAQKVIREAADRLAREADERSRAQAAHLADLIKSGEQRIAAAKAQALANVRTVATDVAASVVERLVGKAANQAKLDASVTAAFEEQGR
ncbi:ATP synthase B' chain [Magnetospirillum fulvum]|jgi:F-type H+-transporting ATPase subunit b|uniref:ATP synthase subunit b n=1 Tax=Magnetospirillum fulvum MGU-K5 TaxID=1316936 RepID=S9SAN9_MAGFU|nr:ATP synthase B' chain [Magnetospirillum fulvum]EPY01774.1 ATP synthase B' chain [Magnetospirillum fulvum MGU-K5]